MANSLKGSAARGGVNQGRKGKGGRKNKGGRKKKGNGGDPAVFDQTAAGANDADSAPQAGHNQAEIDAIVEEAKESVRTAIAERNSLLEKAAALRKKASAQNKIIADAYRRIKSAAGIDRVVMERALELEDMSPEQREKTLEQTARAFHYAGLSEEFAAAYRAAEIGDQMDFLNADAAVSNKTARAAGREAGRAGKPATDNPHAAGSDQHTAWAGGWNEAQAELAEDMRSPASGDEPFPSERVH